MLPEVGIYLREVHGLLHLDQRTKALVLAELRTYFHEKIQELRDEGFSEREATRLAIECCGRPKIIARRMYEAHSHGTLAEAACASMPHLIAGFLFASHLWSQPTWSMPAMLAMVIVTLCAWWNGRPSWLYPWIGYSFLLLLICGWVSKPILGEPFAFALGGGAMPDLPLFSLVLGFMLVSISVVTVTTIRVARRDWILASLMLVPLPLAGGWLASIDGMNGFFGGSPTELHHLDGTMSLALIALAVASAGFILVRQRVLKIGGLAVVGTIAATTVAGNVWGEQGLFGLLAASFLLLLFILSPAVIRVLLSEEEPLPLLETRIW